MSVKNIAIIGAGGFARELLILIQHVNNHEKRWNFVGFYDDNIAKGTIISGFKILGSIDEINIYNKELALARSYKRSC